MGHKDRSGGTMTRHDVLGDGRFQGSSAKNVQGFESAAIKISCFSLKSRKSRNSIAPAPDSPTGMPAKYNDSFSDMVSCLTTKQPTLGADSTIQKGKDTRKAQTQPQEQTTRTVDVQKDQPDICATTNNSSMHDSGSSFKEAGMAKDKGSQPQQAERKQVPDSVDTKPVEELEEGVEDVVLRPEWQINPVDIFFCSKKNNKLLKLGKGGFGTVYKGQWKGRTVAVKICRAQNLTTKAMKQFQTEVAILNSCSHENVVEFIGACCWKGGKRTVLVTEYMEKGDLCTALGHAPHLYTWDNLGKKVAVDVAKGLAFLHSHNVVHFDLKSANILLDRNNHAKLADVGLAKTLTEYHGEDHLSTFLATGDLGTFAWAAPEVLLGFSCNCKADIFSFGVLMWELATGEMPQGRCLRPLRVPEEAPEKVADLIMNCLRHDPALRPTAEDLLKSLQDLQ